MTTIRGRAPREGRLEIDLLTTDRVAFARIAGELDASTASSLIDAIERLLRAGSHDVVLDCGGLRFCDSSGVRALVVIRQALAPGATCTLVRTRPALRQVLDLSGLTHLFTLT